MDGLNLAILSFSRASICKVQLLDFSASYCFWSLSSCSAVAVVPLPQPQPRLSKIVPFIQGLHRHLKPINRHGSRKLQNSLFPKRGRRSVRTRETNLLDGIGWASPRKDGGIIPRKCWIHFQILNLPSIPVRRIQLRKSRAGSRACFKRRSQRVLAH